MSRGKEGMKHMESTVYFSHNLPILRRRAGYTQESLAEALDVSRQAVSKWESGVTLPEAATLLTLAELLDCSLDELMRLELPEDFGARPPVEDPPAETAAEEEPDGDGLLDWYDGHMRRFASTIAAGVMLVLFGVGQLMALIAMGRQRYVVLGVGVLMIFVAAAVALFVYGGLGHDRFRKSFPGFPQGRRPIPTDGFTRRFQVGLPLAIGAIVLDVGGFVVLEVLLHARAGLAVFLLAPFFIVLGVAVAAIVYLGILRSGYSGESAPDASRPGDRESDDPLCGAVMTGCTAIYLVLGFVFHLWHPGWIIFLVGSVICAILNARRKR